MSHYAQLDENNVVVFVIHAKSNDKEDEFTESTGDVYRQTSYNTYGGVHYTDGEPSADQSKAFRFNYAGIGFTYDADRDAFIPPQPYASWVLDEDTCLWVAPIAYPAEGDHVWDEAAGDWVEVTDETV
jgi:hypothetical protein